MNSFKKTIGKYFYNWLYGLKGWKNVSTNNYGFFPVSPEVDSHAGDEKFQVQLYHELGEFAGEYDWENRSVLEVGCGRGGGIRYLYQTYNPKESTGMDFSKNAIRFCTKENGRKKQKVNYVSGDAHSLPFEDKSLDLVLNVESSHIYANQAKFFGEVARVLKDDGFFMITDYRETINNKADIQQLYTDLKEAGLHIHAERDITNNVFQACKRDSERRVELIKAAPFFIRGYLNNYSVITGTKEFDIFEDKNYYFILKLSKTAPKEVVKETQQPKNQEEAAKI